MTLEGELQPRLAEAQAPSGTYQLLSEGSLGNTSTKRFVLVSESRRNIPGNLSVYLKVREGRSPYPYTEHLFEINPDNLVSEIRAYRIEDSSEIETPTDTSPDLIFAEVSEAARVQEGLKSPRLPIRATAPVVPFDEQFGTLIHALKERSPDH